MTKWCIFKPQFKNMVMVIKCPMPIHPCLEFVPNCSQDGTFFGADRLTYCAKNVELPNFWMVGKYPQEYPLT